MSGPTTRNDPREGGRPQSQELTPDAHRVPTSVARLHHPKLCATCSGGRVSAALLEAERIRVHTEHSTTLQALVSGGLRRIADWGET